MAKLPIDTRLKVEVAMEDGMISSRPRPYLGMSSIGAKCPRDLWYSFRFCSNEPISKRLNRLFSRGHNEEPIIVADLAKIGVEHHSDQKEMIDGHGHVKGHCDGILENVPDAPKTPHLAEFKTVNDKGFKAMVKNGLKKSKPVYYAQMITYMDQLGLSRGLFIMVNKNDDSRYYERVYADKAKAKELMGRAIDIISTETPPQKCGDKTWYECKWCNHYQVCQMGETPIKTCRSCDSCDILPEGEWSCSKTGWKLTLDNQLSACEMHKMLATLEV